MIHYLDLRELAQEWEDILEPVDEDDEVGIDEVQKYEDLCDELGLSPARPDTLRWWANENDPTLIPESDFEEYAQDLAEDIGAVGDLAQWPASCIDWEQAANELSTDYSTIEYDGTTYYTR